MEHKYGVLLFYGQHISYIMDSRICLVWKYIVILSNRGTNCALLQTDSKECDAPIKLQSGGSDSSHKPLK